MVVGLGGGDRFSHWSVGGQSTLPAVIAFKIWFDSAWSHLWPDQFCGSMGGRRARNLELGRTSCDDGFVVVGRFLFCQINVKKPAIRSISKNDFI